MCRWALRHTVGILNTTTPIDRSVVAARTPRFGWARSRGEWLIAHRAPLLAAGAISAIAVGFVLSALGEAAAGRMVWRAAVAVLAAELAVEVVRSIVVDHSLGVDAIALVAMVGALALGQELAGAVVGLMFSGGAALETLAAGKARRELTALVQRAPKHTQLRDANGIREVPVDAVRTGDVVVVRTGEVVPVDGTVVSAEAVVDTSTLSGEPLPDTRTRGMRVLSGSANAGAPFELRADSPAAESAYAALVALVQTAASSQAPFVRMADRYAGFFLPATCSWPAPRGPSAVTRSARSRSSSSPRRARSSSPRRSRSSPDCPGRRAPESSSRARVSLRSSAVPGRCCSTRRAR